MRTIFFIVVLNIIALLSYAQENTGNLRVRGKVLDAESQIPIPGTNITIEGIDGFGAMTDMNGEFVLGLLDVGRYDFKASFLGYKPEVKRNVQIQSGKELYLIFELTEMVEELDEVIVKADYDKSQTVNKMATVSARSFNIEETERYAGSLGDPSRMAQNFAGVISAGDQRNDIIIRGNSPTGLLWRLDGVPIPNPNHFGAMGSTGGPVSMLNNNLLTNSDFFTGAFPAEYGNALSGVFDLNMRNGNNQTRQYVFQVGFNGFELGAEGPFSKNHHSSYLLNYRYSTLAVMELLGADASLGGAVPQYQDLSLKVHVPTKKFGTFNLAGMGGISYIVFDQDSENDGSYNNAAGINTRNGSDMGLLNLSHQYFFNEKTRIYSWISGSVYQVETVVDSLEYTDSTQSNVLKELLYFREENKEEKIQAGTKLISKLNSKNLIEFGVSFHSTNVNYLDSVLNNVDTINNTPIYEYNVNTNVTDRYLNLLQAYAQIKRKFTDDFSIYTGIHSQYLDLNRSFAIEPRFNLAYQVSAQHSLSIGYGLHSQMHPGVTYFTRSKLENIPWKYVESNIDLDFTKSHQTAFSYNYAMSQNLRLKIETYYQYLFDVPVKASFSNLNFGANFNFPRIDSLENAGYGQNYGIELTVEKFLSDNYYFLLTASLFDSQFKNEAGEWRNSAFNNQYVVNALGGIEFPIKKRMFINMNLKSVVAGGNPLLAINLEESKKYNTTVYDYANSYEERGPLYFRLDSRISFKINGKKLSQEWALDIQNITNHQNVFSEEYYMNDQGEADTRFNYQQGFFPMFLYRLNF
jgi:hypothetical protein